MPVYQFSIKWDDDQTPDVSYTHLAGEEAARRYAKLLIHELASSGFYSSRPCLLEVKDATGNVLFSLPFREIAHQQTKNPAALQKRPDQSTEGWLAGRPSHLHSDRMLN
jgi:hypothetical protein